MIPAVRVDGVSHRFDDIVALDNISFSVETGEIFGLIGPNGAGKTTLVRTITGTLTPDVGEIQVLGSAPQTMELDRIGFLPQNFTPPVRLTVRELLRYYAGLYDRTRPIDSLLETVGMADRADARYHQLSGGQQRRVCVAIALVNDPDVLFLDEPTTGIDPAGRLLLWDLLQTLVDSGRTILLTTHDMREAESIADRIAILERGSMIELGAPAALVAEHGGSTRLIIECTTDPKDFPSTLDVKQGDDRIWIDGIEPTEIGIVVEHLENANIAFETLTWRQPTMEDVYLNLTGKRERVLRPEATQ